MPSSDSWGRDEADQVPLAEAPSDRGADPPARPRLRAARPCC